MDNGLYSLNEERIRELICKYENVDTKNIKDYYDIRKYKMDQCELRLRLILKKYYIGKKITKEDKKLASGYVMFSSQKLIDHVLTDPDDYVTEALIINYGSGDFNNEEEVILKKIMH